MITDGITEGAIRSAADRILSMGGVMAVLVTDDLQVRALRPKPAVVSRPECIGCYNADAFVPSEQCPDLFSAIREDVSCTFPIVERIAAAAVPKVKGAPKRKASDATKTKKDILNTVNNARRPLSRVDVMSLSGYSESTVKSYLKKLAEEGAIRKFCRARNVFFCAPDMRVRDEDMLTAKVLECIAAHDGITTPQIVSIIKVGDADAAGAVGYLIRTKKIFVAGRGKYVKRNRTYNIYKVVAHG